MTRKRQREIAEAARRFERDRRCLVGLDLDYFETGGPPPDPEAPWLGWLCLRAYERQKKRLLVACGLLDPI